MASANANPIQGNFRPQQFRDPKLDEAFRITFDNLYALRALHDENVAAIQQAGNVTNNITQQVTAIISGNNNSAFPAFTFGVHAARLASGAGAHNGTGWVETDRNNALYSSNGSQWALVAGVASGSFENRYTGLNTTDTGFFYIETGRNNINSAVPPPVYRWDGNNWAFQNGCFARNQNQLTTLANTFTANNSNNGNDIGAVVNVLDFHHQLQWTTANNNSFWQWGPQDDLRAGEGPIFREVDPSPTTGWQLYAGNNNVTYLNSDGTTGTVNLPNLSGNAAGNTAFLRAGETNGNINAPTTPTFTGNNFTPAGTVTGTFSGAGTGSSNSFTTDVFQTLLGGNAALTEPNPVGVSVTVSGSISANFNGTPGPITGSISNNGVPPNIVRRAWFRR